MGLYKRTWLSLIAIQFFILEEKYNKLFQKEKKGLLGSKKLFFIKKLLLKLSIFYKK
jgi:hypothetical protein